MLDLVHNPLGSTALVLPAAPQLGKARGQERKIVIFEHLAGSI
jgi:hypothetical protein